MMQKQFGEPATSASSTQVGEKADVGIVEDKVWKLSINKLRKVCRETMTTTRVGADMVRRIATGWVNLARDMEELSKREGGSTPIFSQANSQIEEWFRQINQAVEKVEHPSQSLEISLASLAGTNSIDAENLIGAIENVQRMIAQIEYRQAKVEAKQAEELGQKAEAVAAEAEKELADLFKPREGVIEEKRRAAKGKRREAGAKVAEARQAREVIEQAQAALEEVPVGAVKKTRVAVLNTNRKLQAIIEKLEKVYFEQIDTAIYVAKIIQREAAGWVDKVEEMRRQHAEDAEIIDYITQIQIQIQEWLQQVNNWVNRAREVRYQHAKVASIAQAVVQNTVKAIKEAERILCQIQTYHAWRRTIDAERAEKIAQKMEEAVIRAEIEAEVMETEAKEEREAEIIAAKQEVDEAREEADRKVEEATKAKVEEAKFKEETKFSRKVETAAYVVTNGSTGPHARTRMGVNVIDIDVQRVFAVIQVGKYPESVAISPNGAWVYVTNMLSGNISVINTTNQRVSKTIRVAEEPTCVAFTPKGSHAYVTHAKYDAVIVIDTVAQEVLIAIPVEQRRSCHHVAITPDGKQIYVAHRYAAVISVIDYDIANINNNNQYQQYQPESQTLEINGKEPIVVAITSDGARAYVVNCDSNNVNVIDTAKRKVVATIPVGERPMDVAITPDGKQAYVTNCHDDSISVIDTATNEILANILVKSYPCSVAITPDGKQAYVAHHYDGMVSVIDITTRKELGTVQVEAFPWDIAIASIPS
jgi:YVTN family beta-propeller protein